MSTFLFQVIYWQYLAAAVSADIWTCTRSERSVQNIPPPFAYKAKLFAHASSNNGILKWSITCGFDWSSCYCLGSSRQTLTSGRDFMTTSTSITTNDIGNHDGMLTRASFTLRMTCICRSCYPFHTIQLMLTRRQMIRAHLVVNNIAVPYVCAEVSDDFPVIWRASIYLAM